ncbi:MAG: glycosyltransferase family 1 protein [Patescibacteria group bacterium]|mgnify:CR=1 FL=1
MKIAIDASSASLENKTGVENVAYQTILCLKKIDKENEYFLYSSVPLAKELQGDNFKNIIIPFKKFWHKFRLPLALFKDKPEALIVFGNEIPGFAPKNSIVYIHDLAFKYFKKAYTKTELIIQNRAIKKDINFGAKIVTVSDSTKKDLIKLYKINQDKIKVIYSGYENIGGKSNLYGDFVFIGRIEKRKNIVNIVKAFEEYKCGNPDKRKLILIGKAGFGFREILKEIDNSKYKNDIKLLGYQPHQKVKQLFNNATALVYPSLYEGFGMPILEAFSTGLPVITSDCSAMKEIAGNSAILIDPDDPSEIAKAMEEIVSDKAKREKLIKDGFQRLKDFDWQNSAKQLIDFIKEGTE